MRGAKAKGSGLGRGVAFLLENSVLLLLGAGAGLLWANLDHAGYEAVRHLPLLDNPWIGTPHGGHRVLDLHFLVNDILMALFFAIAGKEVWEAFLPGGPLADPKKAATPLLATAGGVIVPAGLYLAGAAWLGQMEELASGWAVPCATDIAFSYLVARIVFGPAHAAIPFLLLLAIADDAIGLAILAVFYPQEEVRLPWLLLAALGAGVGVLLRRRKVTSFWPYLMLAGTLSWLGFALSGLHPALGLLPVIPTLPHARIDRGLFDWRELARKDTLSAFEHWWKNPVELILGAFGLLNAGVVLSSVGPATGLVLFGLVVGKPLGIWGFGMLGARGLRLGLPAGISPRDLVVIGLAAGIGFTVALFVATVAFPAGAAQDAAKMGALASLFVSLLAWLAGRLLKVEKMEG